MSIIQKKNLPIAITISVLTIILLKVLDTMSMYSQPIVLNPTPDILEADLTNVLAKYENGETSVINLSTATSFSWDRLYVFGAYTSLEDLESVVGRSWRNVCITDIDVSEFALLVFTREGTVVHCIEYITEKYDFNPLTVYSSGIAIEDSFFLLENRFVVLANKE